MTALGISAIEESRVNATEGYRFADETYSIEGTVFEDMKTVGEVFGWLVREYGRCIGKVYFDSETGPPKHVGWVFQKRDRYEDTREPYLLETWVTLLAKDETVMTREYVNLGG